MMAQVIVTRWKILLLKIQNAVKEMLVRRNVEGDVLLVKKLKMKESVCGKMVVSCLVVQGMIFVLEPVLLAPNLKRVRRSVCIS
jgi:hypothetical protein